MADNVLDAFPGDPFESAPRIRCHLVRVFALTGMGLFADARAEAEGLRDGCLARGEHWTRAYADYQLAPICLFESRPAESAVHARAMLAGKRELGDSFGTALGLDLLAAARAALGDRAYEAAFMEGLRHGHTLRTRAR